MRWNWTIRSTRLLSWLQRKAGTRRPLQAFCSPPQVITHDEVLVGCNDIKNVLTAMDALAEKLGLLLFQFGKFKDSEFKTQAEFLVRLKPFLKNFRRITGSRSRFATRIGWIFDLSICFGSTV